jgi:DNA-binding response OmpR family regulator
MPKKILNIDDDIKINEIVKTVLTKMNYEVATANDGNEGLELVKKDPPDLILLDVVMPSMSGYEFLRAVKALRAIEGKEMIPVIIVTAKREMEDVFRYEGVKEYMVKPVVSSDLIEKVKKHLGPAD